MYSDRVAARVVLIDGVALPHDRRTDRSEQSHSCLTHPRPPGSITVYYGHADQAKIPRWPVLYGDP